VEIIDRQSRSEVAGSCADFAIRAVWRPRHSGQHTLWAAAGLRAATSAVTRRVYSPPTESHVP
jgi:hypothetical protein